MSKMYQAVVTLNYGDAVGNDVMAIQQILHEEGYDTALYVENASPKIPKNAYHLYRDMPAMKKDDILIYHLSIGAQMNYDIAQKGGRKVIVYHNVTPPEFFRDYSSGTIHATTEGLKGVQFLADVADYAIADSAFNKQDLLDMGYQCPIDVCPIVIPFSDYDQKPDQAVISRYKDDGYTNLLFVGRIVPNKRQENLVRAFYYYQKYFNPKSRLFLVGNWSGMERYYNRLTDYIELLGLTDSVILPGHIKFSEILAYYHLADAFVCLSEHEGFCVPLVEAMYFNLPIIAYDTSAIGDTLGGSGLLLDSNEPGVVAAAIHHVLTDQKLRETLLAGQKRRLEDFRYASVKKRFLEILNKIK